MCPTTKGKVFEFCLSGWVDPKFRNRGSVTGVVYDYVKPLLGLLSLCRSNLVLFQIFFLFLFHYIN